ncbi:MAG TPA: hypothetical protein VIK78_19645 [Ruminiclostridium sp.]
MEDFKVKCVDLQGINEDYYTLNKVYEVKGGQILANVGLSLGENLENIEDVNRFSASRFELVVDKPSFKVRCVKSVSKWFVTGKEYEVVGGFLKDETGTNYNCYGGCDSLETLNRCSFNQFELVEEKMFSKSDLKTGMRVETRGGYECMVLIGTPTGDTITGEDMWFGMQELTEDLKYKSYGKNSDCDIMKVYNPNCNREYHHFTPTEHNLVWERTLPLTMTISEAQSELSKLKGKEVQITKE